MYRGQKLQVHYKVSKFLWATNPNGLWFLSHEWGEVQSFCDICHQNNVFYIEGFPKEK